MLIDTKMTQKKSVILGSNQMKAYFDGGFWKIQCSRQLASPRPGHVVLPIELLLQPGDLLPGEGGSVPANLVRCIGQSALTRYRLTRVTSCVTPATWRIFHLTCVKTQKKIIIIDKK